MKMKRLFLAALFCLGWTAGALEPLALAADRAPASDAAKGRESVENPRIAVGDSISISIYPAEEYNREATVQPDGKIDLALIGSMTIKDLTARELQDLLETKYAKYLDHPKVSVVTRHFVGRRVALIGEAKGTGFYEYKDGMKMLDLIDMAGGISDNARTTRVTILRPGTQSITFNFQAVLDGDLSRDILILPGDTVYIPKTPLNKKSTWLSNNIVPWLSLFALISSTVVLAKTQ